jgi:hypothetical protein
MGFDSAYRSARGGVSKAYKKAAPIAKKNAPIVRDAYMANTPKATREKHARSYSMVKSDVQGSKKTVGRDFGPSPKAPSSSAPVSSSPSAPRSKPRPAVISPRAQTYAPVEKGPSKSQSTASKIRKHAMYGAYGKPIAKPPVGRPRY